MTSNLEQDLVIKSNNLKTLCLAGAGTGKTYTLIERIKYLLSTGVSPDSMLVLTFTNAAAYEMKERFDKSNLDSPLFCTFHAFCYSLLINDRDVLTKLGYRSTPEVITDDDLNKLEQTVLVCNNIKLSKRKRSGQAPILPKEQFEYDLYRKAMQKAVLDKNVITFDMLSNRVCDLFIHDDATILKYKAQYKYIFVDEFQDTDPCQFAFVESFDNSNLFVVGDALQSLYAFRGADSSIIKSLANSPNWTTYRLQKNYRSDIDICNYANEKSIYADGSYRVCIQPVSDQTGFVREYIVDSFMGEDNNICLDILNESNDDETVAVIARTNAEVDRIKKFLDQHNIKYDNPVQSDILPMLRHMNDEQSMIDWLASKLLSNDYTLYLKDRYINKDTYTLAQFYQHFGGKQAISDIMGKLMAIQEIVANSTDFATDSNAVLSILGFETYVLPDYVTDFNLLFDNLIQYIEHHNTADARLHVGTIHSVKGLEYDTVIVYGVRSNYFRLDNEDNLNLFYVAITRAKHRLYIFKEHYYGI